MFLVDVAHFTQLFVYIKKFLYVLFLTAVICSLTDRRLHLVAAIVAKYASIPASSSIVTIGFLHRHFITLILHFIFTCWDCSEHSNILNLSSARIPIPSRCLHLDPGAVWEEFLVSFLVVKIFIWLFHDLCCRFHASSPFDHRRLEYRDLFQLRLYFFNLQDPEF